MFKPFSGYNAEHSQVVTHRNAQQEFADYTEFGETGGRKHNKHVKTHAPADLDPAAEVKFWMDKTAELSLPPHKPPPTKVVPDDCPVYQEHHFWREHVANLSSPTPEGKSIIDIHPPRGAGYDEEIAYWKQKMDELCKPIDELIEHDKGHQAARRRSYEPEEAMFFDKERGRPRRKKKSTFQARASKEDSVKSLAEFIALLESASSEDVADCFSMLSAQNMRRLRMNIGGMEAEELPPIVPQTIAVKKEPEEKPAKMPEVVVPKVVVPKVETSNKVPKVETSNKLPEPGNNNAQWELHPKLSARQEAMLRASKGPPVSEEIEEAMGEEERMSMLRTT